MKFQLLSFALALAFILTACNEKAPKQTNFPAGTTDASSPTFEPPILKDGLSGSAATPAAAAPAVAGAAGKVNPPHGQPGHRCDIAVGAPLDGAPAASGSSLSGPQLAAPTARPVTVSPSSPAGAATVAAGANPPHGQPGHRCDIAVGAPLNSPPSNSSAGRASSLSGPLARPQISAPTTRPITVTPSAAAATTTVKTAPGTNPPHGQPGHRCDIAVGAPLK